MNHKDQLLHSLNPILEFLNGKEISPSLQTALNHQFPLDSSYMQQLKLKCLVGIQEKWLCPRNGGNLTYGRLAKSSEQTHHFGIDTVDMSATGPGHTHPQGEVDLCFTIDGSPLFDGNPEGWTVYGSNSWHVPTVTRGRMAILYFLPDGAISFGPKPT